MTKLFDILVIEKPQSICRETKLVFLLDSENNSQIFARTSLKKLIRILEYRVKGSI